MRRASAATVRLRSSTITTVTGLLACGRHRTARGVGAAVNTVRGGATAAIESVADGGRLATITGDPPETERGVTVADVYVRADGARLAALVAALADGMLSLRLGERFPLAVAAAALKTVSAGRASGATVLTLSHGPATLRQNR